MPSNRVSGNQDGQGRHSMQDGGAGVLEPAHTGSGILQAIGSLKWPRWKHSHHQISKCCSSEFFSLESWLANTPSGSERDRLTPDGSSQRPSIPPLMFRGPGASLHPENKPVGVGGEERVLGRALSSTQVLVQMGCSGPSFAFHLELEEILKELGWCLSGR